MSAEPFDLEFRYPPHEHGVLVKHSLLTGLAIPASMPFSRGPEHACDNYGCGYRFGPLELNSCEEEAKEPTFVDELGHGESCASPYGGVETVVIKQTPQIYITSEQVRADKTGDGIPVAMTTCVLERGRGVKRRAYEVTAPVHDPNPIHHQSSPFVDTPQSGC